MTSGFNMQMPSDRIDVPSYNTDRTTPLLCDLAHFWNAGPENRALALRAATENARAAKAVSASTKKDATNGRA